jgi:hypothetical protein
MTKQRLGRSTFSPPYGTSSPASETRQKQDMTEHSMPKTKAHAGYTLHTLQDTKRVQNAAESAARKIRLSWSRRKPGEHCSRYLNKQSENRTLKTKKAPETGAFSESFGSNWMI